MSEQLSELDKMIADTEAELAKAQDLEAKEAENAPKPEPEILKEQEKEEEATEEEKSEPEEPETEEKKTEADSEDEEKEPTPSAYAKMRREKRELAAEKARLEAELAAQRNAAPAAKPQAQEPEKAAEPKKSEPETVNDPEPDRATDYEAWLEWKDRQSERKLDSQGQTISVLQEKLESLFKEREEQKRVQEHVQTIQSAVSEFTDIEAKYKETNPDYGNAVEFGKKQYANALKLINPSLTKAQIDATIDREMLTFAAQAKMKGLNPAEELYDYAIERFGYVPQTQQPENPAPKLERPVQKKPNLAVIEGNKRRSASALSSGGQGASATLTAADFEAMTQSEFSRLSPSQLRELEAAAGIAS